MNPSLVENSTPAPVPFRRTLQSLEIDKARDRRAPTALVVVAALAWAAWSVTARIPIYASSDVARLESQMSTYRIAPAVDGHIVRADLQLGQIVQKGQVLVELDSTTPQNALEEGTTRLAALRRDVLALNRQIEAETRAFEADRARQAVAIQEAGAAADEATAYLEAARRQSDDLENCAWPGLSPPPPRPPLRRRRKRKPRAWRPSTWDGSGSRRRARCRPPKPNRAWQRSCAAHASRRRGGGLGERDCTAPARYRAAAHRRAGIGTDRRAAERPRGNVHQRRRGARDSRA